MDQTGQLISRNSNWIFAWLVLLMVSVALPLATFADVVSMTELQARNEMPHPRLLMNRAGWADLKTNIAKNARLQKWYKKLQIEANDLLSTPVTNYSTGAADGYLAESRQALRTITLMAGLYQIDRQSEKARRATRELLALANLPDWKGSQFLDTAELTMAASIGYDWMYPFLSETDREKIRAAIVRNGVTPGREAYEAGLGFTKWKHNWAQVCAGSLIVGSIAVIEHEPDLASRVINLTEPRLRAGMEKYEAEGGDPEGPMYWRYGSSYNVLALAAMRLALGTTFGLIAAPGFNKTGYFRIHTTTPTGETYNFSDSNSNEHKHDYYRPGNSRIQRGLASSERETDRRLVIRSAHYQALTTASYLLKSALNARLNFR